jgi:DNA-binding transcriptional regulator WhiA
MEEELHPEQIKALRRMTPAQRLRVGLEFMEELRQLKAAALRVQHPDWSAERIAEALREFIRHGAS